MNNEKGQWKPWMAITTALIEDDMTQQQLAAKLGWDPSKVSRLASGKQRPYADELQQIAEAQGRELG